MVKMTTAGSVDALLDAVPERVQIGPFGKWLAEDAARAAEFWAYMEKGNWERGKSVENLLPVWNANRPPCPVSACRVRERLRERRR